MKLFEWIFEPAGPGRIGWRAFLARSLAVLGSGLLMTTALPPLNWSGMIWVALVPGLLVLLNARPLAGGFYAWLWAAAYGTAGYFWLREIHPAVPWLIGPIYGLYFLPLGWLAGWMRRAFLMPVEVQLQGYEAERAAPCPAWWREIGLVLLVAAFFTVLEALRWHILPWNYLAATQWRNPGLIGLVSYTGSYGITFLIVLVNAAIAVTLLELLRSRRLFRRAWGMLFAIVLLAAAIFLARLAVAPSPEPVVTKGFTIGVIQPDPPCRSLNLSQEERAAQDRDALAANLALSREAAAGLPQLLLWPETSIGTFFRSDTSLFAISYRNQVRDLLKEIRIPLMLGTLDWEELPRDSERTPGYTNTTWLMGSNPDGSMTFLDRYDKQHLVPFGEYVPFRRWIPEWVSETISMGGDLTPGKRMSPLAAPEGFLAGVNICFEDVFPYIARAQVRRGADYLIVMTNDSWYPASAEPEQHLANSVFRAVETGVPMIRCGSNSGTVQIHPDGRIEGLPGVPYTERARASGTFSVTVPTEYRPTFFVRFGDWFLRVCEGMLAAGLIFCAVVWRRRAARLIAIAEPTEETLHE